jgi:hypothetical protein
MLMISYQNDPSARLLKSYIPPFRGTWKTLPSNLLPDDVVQDSMNVTLLSGKLRSRLGLVAYSNLIFTDKTDTPSPVIGSFQFIDVTNTKLPLASTNSRLFQYIPDDWTDITGSVNLNVNTTQVRMTSIQTGTHVYLLYANGLDALKYKQDQGNLQDITPYVDPDTGPSSIPIFTDLCTSFSRVVGFTPPYTVAWCPAVTDAYLNFTNWPALNQVILSDTEDSIVAIGSLGTLGLAIYKEGNIFVGFAQGGSDAAAFRFEHRGAYPGPAGIQAKINAFGGHVYMTNTGRIAFFDGTQHQWIADGLWPFLQDDLDVTYAKNIFGVYNYKTSEVYFWYPKIGDAGALKGMVILNAPYPTAGITTTSYFLGHTDFSCTNGLSTPLFNDSTNPFVFGENRVFNLSKDAYTDNNTAFSCSFTTGLFKPTPLQALPGAQQDKSDIYRPIFELYVTRDSSRKTVQLSGIVSNSLETNGTDTEETEIIDLTTTPINEFVGFNSAGSFIGVKLAWESSAKVEYKGCDVYGRTST